MSAVVGKSSNDSWTIPNGSSWSGTLDGLGGVDTLSLLGLQRNQFTLTDNADGTITLDSVQTIAAASGNTSKIKDHIVLSNVEIIQYNNNASTIDLRTLFPDAFSSTDIANANFKNLTDSVLIKDTSANIAANLLLLEANISKIFSISQVGTVAPLAISVAELLSDGAVLEKITNAYSLNINDTANSVALHLNELQAKIANVNAINLSDISVPLSLSAKQVISDSAILNKISTAYTLDISDTLVSNFLAVLKNKQVVSVAINDTSAHIAAKLNLLETNQLHITSITQTNPTLPLKITAGQLVLDADVLGKMNTYTLDINDVSKNIVTNLDLLERHIADINSITLNDKSPLLHVSAQQFTANQAVFNKIVSNFHVEINGASDTDVIIKFAEKVDDAPSASDVDKIINWNSHDSIAYITALTVSGNSDIASKGLASINPLSGIATFNSSDKTLAKQLVAVEKAMSLSGDSVSGHVAIWQNGLNTEILIRDSHIGASISAGDELIQLTGVNIANVGLTADGTIHYV